MTVTISRGVLSAIREYAAAAPNSEVCGLLLGDGAHVTHVLPSRNVADDPSRSFEIDPGLLITALKQARLGGPEPIGCYHSHPGGSTRPSANDAAATGRSGWIWLIIATDMVEAWREAPGGTHLNAFDWTGITVVDTGG